LSKFTFFDAGGGIETGSLQVRPSSVDRFTRTEGTATLVVSGIEEISHVLCAAS
jgi:hypothetical protein